MNRIVAHSILALASTAVLAGGVFWLKYEDWVTLPRARSLISDKLRDPAGAQFRKDELRKNGWLCGEINTKNGSGGYVGFSRFMSHGQPNTYIIEDIGFLDTETTEQITARLRNENILLDEYLRRRDENPSYQIPSVAYIQTMANKQLFNDHWKEYCEE